MNIPSQPNGPTPTEEDFSGENVLDLILNNLEDNFLLIDKNLRILLFNEATRQKALEYLGVSIQKGSSVLQLAPIERHPFLRELYHQVFEGNTRVSETRILQSDTVIYFENLFKPVRDSGGQVVGAIVSARNITARKNAELEEQQAKENLEFSEQQYKTLFQNNPLPCWIYDPESLRFMEVNEAAIRHYGYTKQEFLELGVLDVQVEENIEVLKKRFDTNQIQKIHFLNNWQHKLKDGRTIFTDLRSSSIHYQGKEARLVVVHDITPRVVMENELRKSNERFKLAARATSESLWEWDFRTKEAYISPTYTEVFGWRADEFRKFDEWEDYIHQDDREETIRSYDRAIENEKVEKWEREYRYLKSDGTYAFVHDKAVILRDESGKAVRVIGALEDRTEQKRTEEELRKSNERFLLASRAASDAIYEWDIVANELYWGEGLQTLFGFNPKEVTLLVWESLIHPDEKDRVLQTLGDTLADPGKKIWNEEYRFRRTDGSFSYVLERGFIVRDQEGRPLRMIGSLQDSTERKRHEQLLSLERFIFELSANPEKSLKEVVVSLLKGIEAIYSQAITTVLLLQEDETIQHLASPSLPEAYVSGVNGRKIGPDQGTCGACMYLKKTIIVPDIENDNMCLDYRRFVESFHLKSCWSLPVIHTSGKVMGSFTIYHTFPKYPTASELSTVERLRNILRIVIENRLSLQEIKNSNERFDIMMNATHDLVWDWNLQTGKIYRDPAGLQKVFGVKLNSSMETIGKFLERIHPEDKIRVQKVISEILRPNDNNNVDVEYRFQRDDGTYSHVYDRGIILKDENGKPVRMIGAAQDISERKRLEKELLANELEHQKAINLATVETQEQERTEIGKELHDNVNQVLTTTKLYLDLALSSPDLKDELIQKSTKNIINVINEIRQLSRSLMDPSIGDLGLIDSIHDLIENINLTRKLHVSLKTKAGIEDLLDKNQKLTIFRIIQEALNNAIRHAKATSVVIQFLVHGNSAKVMIEDDGIGFNIQTVKKGAGLKNIQNRIYLINGSHSIQSIPGKGSKILINFPIIQTNKVHPI
ncbi:MAG: PAS domain-containing protein [Flavisolibacter sp.]